MTAITSIEALRYVTETGKRETQRQLVETAIARNPGLTASELDAILHIGPVSVRRRLSDLKNEGLAIRGEPRRARGMVIRECTWFGVERQGVLL